ncbi:hypothetical protein STEG23_023090, partial [Scotinomys teguina]
LPIMILMPLAHTITPLSLTGLLELCLVFGCDFCICFHQSLEKSSVMTIRLFTILVTGSLAEEHLGCFQVLAITNNASVNTVEHMSLWY